MKKIAIFASGSGTNAEAIIRYFENRPDVTIALILSNKADAFVLQRAANHGIPSQVFTKEELVSGQVLELLKSHHIDLVVLAGFLLLIPKDLVEAFPDRIINIHPALLPSYGGKGMYGARVHEAVIKNQEKESGITIHYVNAQYDEGDIIIQARCPVTTNDTPDDLASRIHELEYKYFPATIDKIVSAI
jgi:phosphoribosylglycinamide formyltransferase-1